MKSLSSRLTLWYALVVTLTVAVLLLLGRFYLEHSLIKGVDLLNSVEFEEVRTRIDLAGAKGEAAVLEAVRKHAELDAALYFFQVGRGHGDLLYKSSNLGPHALPLDVHGQANITVNDAELGRLRSAEFNYAGLDIHIASSLQSADQLFDDYEGVSVVVCAVIFLLSLGLGYFLSRLAIHPIVAIQSKARRITASSFGERIPIPNTDDEIARMAEFLNEMLDRLETSYEQIKRFTAEASHELRTPLSIIRLQAERLSQEGALSDQDRRDGATEQLEEIGRLNKLIDDMLLLAKADAGVMQLKCQTVEPSEFLEDFRCDATLLADDRGVRFRLLNEFDGIVRFDPVWMRHVLLNLLTNALNHSQPGDDLELSFKKESGGPVFRVIDAGPGLPEDKLEVIFERFQRLDPEQNPGGNGLGLAICRSIVERHGGCIQAFNRSDRSGLIIEVQLPEKARCCEVG